MKRYNKNMLDVVIAMIIIGILGFIVIIIRYNVGDPFEYCGRRVYVEN